jgi:hypothetical protein
VQETHLAQAHHKEITADKHRQLAQLQAVVVHLPLVLAVQDNLTRAVLAVLVVRQALQVQALHALAVAVAVVIALVVVPVVLAVVVLAGPVVVLELMARQILAAVVVVLARQVQRWQVTAVRV